MGTVLRCPADLASHIRLCFAMHEAPVLVEGVAKIAKIARAM